MYQITFLRLPTARVGHDKKLAKNKARFWQLTDKSFTPANISASNLRKQNMKVMQTAFLNYLHLH